MWVLHSTPVSATIRSPAGATAHAASPAASVAAWRTVGPRHTLRCTATQAPQTPSSDTQQQNGTMTSTIDPLQALSALAGSQSGAAAGQAADIAAVTKEVLMSDPETAEQLKRYEAALARVEAAKAAATELEEIFAQAGRDAAAAEAEQEAETKRKADEMMAAAEVAAAEKMLAAAQLEAALAAQAQADLAQAANQDVDRVESVKAGVVAAVGGLLSAVPLMLAAQSEGSGLAAAYGGSGISNVLSLATTAGSCFLFGVTYRYVVRWDSTNSHLRNGAVGAFGLVRAAAAADTLQSRSVSGPFDLEQVVGPALLFTGESMILFAFSAAAVELAFRQGFLTRFGTHPAAAPPAAEQK